MMAPTATRFHLQSCSPADRSNGGRCQRSPGNVLQAVVRYLKPSRQLQRTGPLPGTAPHAGHGFLFAGTAVGQADVALLVVSAKGRELEAALKEALGQLQQLQNAKTWYSEAVEVQAGGGPSTLAEQLRAARGLGTAAKVRFLCEESSSSFGAKHPSFQEGRLAVAVTKMDEASWAQAG